MCLSILLTNAFNIAINLFIIINTVALSWDHYRIDEDQGIVLDYINFVLSAIFLLEMIIKLIGMGFKFYFKDKFNAFDSFIVAISVVDIALTLSNTTTNDGGAITAMRGFRLLRIFKLAKSWRELQELLKTIASTIKDVSYFSLLLFLFISTYSLLGMQIFGHKMKFNDQDQLDLENGSVPDSTFDNYLEGFYSVFIVLANDGWSTIYFNCYRAVGSAVSTLFFLTLLLLGQYMLLNLFLTILLSNFGSD